MKKWTGLPWVLILLILLISCAKKRDTEPDVSSEDVSSQGVSSPEDSVSPGATGLQPSKQGIPGQESPEQETPPDPGTAQDGPHLLTLPQAGRTLPEDFKIGPLEDLLVTDRERDRLIFRARSFLDALVEGRIDQQSLLETSRTRLTRSLTHYVERELLPRSYRLGRITLPEQETPPVGDAREVRAEDAGGDSADGSSDNGPPGTAAPEGGSAGIDTAAGTSEGGSSGADVPAAAPAGTPAGTPERRNSQGLPDQAWLNVRLFGKVGISEGELYLSKVEGKWYIADIQIGFEQLNQAYLRGEEKFVPSVYGWRTP